MVDNKQLQENKSVLITHSYAICTIKIRAGTFEVSYVYDNIGKLFYIDELRKFL